MDGVQLQLQQTQRTVKVAVVHGDQAVPGASVRATLEGGSSVTVHADSQGVASVPLMNEDRIHQLTAWTDDFRFGGYSFPTDPPRDPAGTEFQVELDQCRKQKMRLIDQATKEPLTNLKFHLTIGTGPPDYQFPGKLPQDNVLTTDESGEATCRWFPDWSDHYSYVRVQDTYTVDSYESELLDEVLVYSVRMANRTPRQTVRGIVRADEGHAAGFLVQMRSFQSELPGYSDLLYAFTQPDGTFTVECFPDSTYCAYVNDVRYVTRIVDGIPAPKDADVNKWQPQLDLLEGRPVQVVVVGGPDQKPIPFQQIQLSTEHRMPWIEDGQQRYGRSGRRWGVTTNRLGRTFTYALPDTEVTGAIYNARWRMERSVNVKAEGITRLTFHRPHLEPRSIVGKIELPEGRRLKFDGIKVQAGALDGETEWEAEIPVRSDGTFEIQTTATRFGLYARASGGELAGVLVAGDEVDQVTLPLKPATGRLGRLVTPDQQPIAHQKVNGVVEIGAGIDGFRVRQPRAFRPTVESVTTDGNGRFEMAGIPGDKQLQITVRTVGRFGYDHLLTTQKPQKPDVDVDVEYVIDPKELAEP
jgi:hypothetical protein